jgi:nucleotide-binding universal stress UspA family protein
MDESYTPTSVVVGIDGSKAAVRAALWAVDEAVSRDVPLRLVYAIGAPHSRALTADEAARRLATAEIAIRYAFMAVEATDKPVKIEVEIDQGHPLSTLIRASRSAAVMCVGAVGLHRSAPRRVGSTAARLAASAHCPVAIIRERADLLRLSGGKILVETGDSPDADVVLGHAMEEARLRNAAVHAVTSCHCGRSDIHEHQVALDRRLAHWHNDYPEVVMRCVAVHDTIVDYLTGSAGLVQLIVVGSGSARHPEGLAEEVGTAALERADCSVLMV